MKKTTIQAQKPVKDYHNTPMFGKANYRLMIIGAIAMTLGFILMAGGRSADPNVFNEEAIYSFRRITLAPILIVGGLIVEVFAIMKKTGEKPTT